MVPTLRHVLVAGVDGVRFDLLGPEVTPVIWGFGRDGFLGPVPVGETTPTWSGPCWATIATGCGVDRHGVTGNDLTGHRLAEHPDFLTVPTRAGLPTLLAVSGWPPLALAEDGGPLFAEAARREFMAVAEVSLGQPDRGTAGVPQPTSESAGRARALAPRSVRYQRKVAPITAEMSPIRAPGAAAAIQAMAWISPGVLISTTGHPSFAV
jgi:Type I phosphodiesterase / nucleotide pyrophosphatase